MTSVVLVVYRAAKEGHDLSAPLSYDDDYYYYYCYYYYYYHLLLLLLLLTGEEFAQLCHNGPLFYYH